MRQSHCYGHPGAASDVAEEEGWRRCTPRQATHSVRLRRHY